MVNPSAIGWTVFIAALGMALGLLGSEIQSMNDWQYIRTPLFVGKACIHMASVIAAFVGGKLLPSPPADAQPGGRRSSDPPPKE
jgi:hypothetical protein